MEQNIKNYLIHNASNYAKFKGYDESFINSINELESDEGLSPEVQEYYDLAIQALKEGGLIPKFQIGGVNGTRDNWRTDVFNKLKEDLLRRLKLGLEGKEGGITVDEFNNYQRGHHDVWKSAGSDYYTNAYKDKRVSPLQSLYQGWGFNELAIKPNWNTRYKINSSNPNSGDNLGNWTSDGLFSGITDDRRLGREGDWDDESLKAFNTELANLGLSYGLDNETGYYMLNKKTDTKPDVSKSPETKSPELKSGFPTGVTNPLLKLRGLDISPALQFAGFLDALHTNKKMYDFYQRNYAWNGITDLPFHLNIEGNLGALNQSYNLAANTNSLASRIGNSYSDSRTGIAAQLQGNVNAQQQIYLGNTEYNKGVKESAAQATALEKENLQNYVKKVNENSDRNTAARNMLLNNTLEYWNQGYANRKALYDWLALESKTKLQNSRNFNQLVLTQWMLDAINEDPEVQKYEKLWREKLDDASWQLYNNAKIKVKRKLTPIYYESLAKNRGIYNFDYSNNPFIIYGKSGTKISDDGPVRTRSKTLERHRKATKDWLDDNSKKLDRLGRLTYLYAKRAQGKKK